MLVKIILERRNNIKLREDEEGAPDYEVVDDYHYKSVDVSILGTRESICSEVTKYRAFGHVWGHGGIKDSAAGTRYFYNLHKCHGDCKIEQQIFHLYKNGKYQYAVLLWTGDKEGEIPEGMELLTPLEHEVRVEGEAQVQTEEEEEND